MITAAGGSTPIDRLDGETTVTVNDRSASAVEQDGRAVVFWTEGEVTTAVAVEGTIDDAQAAAGAL